MRVTLDTKAARRHPDSDASWFYRLSVERADIADRLTKLFGANHAAHDFAGARLGQAGCELQLFWNGQSADGCTNVQL